MADTFSLHKVDLTRDTVALKWQQGNNKYEIHVSTLDNLELSTIVPHCLDILDKVLSVVSTDNHKGPSLFKVFPRTLTTAVKTIYEGIKIEHVAGLIAANANATTDSEDAFKDVLKLFIAAHATPDDQHRCRIQPSPDPWQSSHTFIASVN